jgi:hypothetical protein
MATLKKNHFSGGAALTAKQGNSGPDSLQQFIADIAADFAALQQPALSAPAATTVAVADGSDPATTMALANALKVQVNILIAAVNELRADSIAAGGHTLLTVVE